MMMQIFLNLCIAHIVGDFYLQWNNQCRNKAQNGVKGYGLWYHTAVVALLSWMALWDWSAWWLVAVIAVSHWGIDACKAWLSGKCSERKCDLGLFVVDQLVHVGVIYVVACLWYEQNPSWTQFEWMISLENQHPLWLSTGVAMALVLKPANILILHILDFCKVKVTDSENHGNFHSGELIGWLERGLMLMFVILGQYEAIGFLIAGKSILRFGEANDGEKSEYVLTGTLLSLFFALGLGLLVKLVVEGNI